MPVQVCVFQIIQSSPKPSLTLYETVNSCWIFLRAVKPDSGQQGLTEGGAPGSSIFPPPQCRTHWHLPPSLSDTIPYQTLPSRHSLSPPPDLFPQNIKLLNNVTGLNGVSVKWQRIVHWYPTDRFKSHFHDWLAFATSSKWLNLFLTVSIFLSIKEER